jgi:hypothetical protein
MNFVTVDSIRHRQKTLGTKFKKQNLSLLYYHYKIKEIERNKEILDPGFIDTTKKKNAKEYLYCE